MAETYIRYGNAVITEVTATHATIRAYDSAAPGLKLRLPALAEEWRDHVYAPVLTRDGLSNLSPFWRALFLCDIGAVGCVDVYRYYELYDIQWDIDDADVSPADCGLPTAFAFPYDYPEICDLTDDSEDVSPADMAMEALTERFGFLIRGAQWREASVGMLGGSDGVLDS